MNKIIAGSITTSRLLMRSMWLKAGEKDLVLGLFAQNMN